MAPRRGVIAIASHNFANDSDDSDDAPSRARRGDARLDDLGAAIFVQTKGARAPSPRLIDVQPSPRSGGKAAVSPSKAASPTRPAPPRPQPPQQPQQPLPTRRLGPPRADAPRVVSQQAVGQRDDEGHEAAAAKTPLRRGSEDEFGFEEGDVGRQLDAPLRAAQLRSEELAKRVREEHGRMVAQRQKMLELEKKSATSASRVAAAEAKLEADEARLREIAERDRLDGEARLLERQERAASRLRGLEAHLERDEAAKIAAHAALVLARRESTAASIADMEKSTEADVAQAALRRAAALAAISAEDDAATAAAAKRRSANASRLAALEAAQLAKNTSRLAELQAQNVAMEQKFAELERERGEREAELAAAQQQSATRQLGPHQSLSDVLYTHAEDEEEDEEDLPDDDALPDAHKHAASGEVHRCSDADLEAKDAAERTPLFYAAAAGRADTVAAIVARAPHTASAVDANGDTALHAAASAGSADVARAILGAAGDIATVANGHGMHAAHLCSNAETLEVLLECGASFTAEDGQKRTPLFVACAMNRFECATFLLEVLDLEPDGRSAINAADARGDTPLHAAACNGAEACVRLLLESGTENIDARNAAGMRPRDLAAKRGHRGCERLLTEYALHIASDANFDTVLFLASLEGHRQCKKAFEEDTVPYEILRRTHSSASNSSAQDLFPTGGPSPAKAVARTKSRWSLKRGVSMKLAQWGNWIAYEEPDHATIFWYNHVTGAGQWTKPDAVTQAQAKHQSPDEEKHWEAMRHRSMRLSQTGDWLQYREHGTARPFWYHPKSGEFQWSRPDSLPPSDEAPLETAPEYTEAQPWAAYADPETGVPFWYNHVSGESQWEEPAGVDGLDEPAELCHSLDDLGI